MERRKELKYLRLSSARKKVEYAKVDKATKREICKDIHNHFTTVTRQIMEGARSTRKANLTLN